MAEARRTIVTPSNPVNEARHPANPGLPQRERSQRRLAGWWPTQPFLEATRSLFLLILLFLRQIISDRVRVPRGNPGPPTLRQTTKQRDSPLFRRCFPLFSWERRPLGARV